MAANSGSVAIGRIVPAIPALAGAQSKARQRVGASLENAQPSATAKPTEPAQPAPPKSASLFDMPTPAAKVPFPQPMEEDPGFAEIDDDELVEDAEELEDAA